MLASHSVYSGFKGRENASECFEFGVIDQDLEDTADSIASVRKRKAASLDLDRTFDDTASKLPKKVKTAGQYTLKSSRTI